MAHESPTGKPSLGKPSLCLILEGLTSYIWQNREITLYPPALGTFEFIREAQKHFEVYIYSKHSHDQYVREALWKWFKIHTGADNAWVNALHFPHEKPQAAITIDNLSRQQPDIAELLAFKRRAGHE